jgi:hypothetical protein
MHYCDRSGMRDIEGCLLLSQQLLLLLERGAAFVCAGPSVLMC